MADVFDVAVIGAGPGGYVAAIRCAQLGLRTICVDSGRNARGAPSLGGTCLNVGCIPSKAMLESSELYAKTNGGLVDHGITVDGVTLNLADMLKRKDKIVDKSTNGIAFLFRKNKIESRPGHARLLSIGEICRIEVSNDAMRDEIACRHVIIATGSIPAQLPIFPFDGDRIVDNAGALSFKSVPKRLGIVGAGVIGLELGSVWRRLGSEVTILESRDQFLPMADEQVAAEANKQLTREGGLDIRLGARISTAVREKSSVKVQLDTDQGAATLEFDRVLVAAGRVPNTAELNAEAVGLARNGRGYIEVDEHCQTAFSNVYAIGDCVRGPMLAHKASEEGLAVAERIAGQKPETNYGAIPSVIYTAPEIAWVGATEQSLKSGGHVYRKGLFWFLASGRALALGETKGFVKVLVDDSTDRLLGVHMIGPRVSELVAEAVVAMEFSAAGEDLARICHAHPTLSEALHEAALAALGRPLNQ